MRLTTLLETIPQGGSGPWNRTKAQTTADTAPAAAAPLSLPTTATDGGRTPAPDTAGTLLRDGDAAEFDRLLAGILPCRSNDPELWFAEGQADVERAKALCATCPLVEGCLAGAVDRCEPWGVWGGQVFVDGVVVPTKRGRGRPRKVA